MRWPERTHRDLRAKVWTRWMQAGPTSAHGGSWWSLASTGVQVDEDGERRRGPQRAEWLRRLDWIGRGPENESGRLREGSQWAARLLLGDWAAPSDPSGE